MAAQACIRPFAPADLPGAFDLLSTQGWAHRVHDAPALLRLIEALLRLIEASQRVVVAEAAGPEGQAGQIIGFARAISDGLSNGHIAMAVVAPAHQRQGIGRQLVQALMVGGPGISWMLRASRSQAPEFFAKLGFVPAPDAMARPRAVQTSAQ